MITNEYLPIRVYDEAAGETLTGFAGSRRVHPEPETYI